MPTGRETAEEIQRLYDAILSEGSVQDRLEEAIATSSTTSEAVGEVLAVMEDVLGRIQAVFLDVNDDDDYDEMDNDW